MLFSEEWLRHYINPPLDTEALCETLTMGGLEVEGSEPVAPAFTGVVVAQILEVGDHPNADKLHICKVDVGQEEPLQIVCGAPNAAAGIKVPCAMIGAELPGGFQIKKSKLRGVDSYGMLCSARELGLSQDHSGLWVLPEDAPVGENIRTYERLDDQRIEVKLTPNRGDALSVIGVARDLRAMTGAEMSMPDFSPVAPSCACTHEVVVEATDLCGRFTGRVVRGLNAKAPTPQWMKDRLERSGQRSISALVDISNYVMLEIGRPTHVFDLDKVNGPLVVRWAKEGEKVELLNGQTVDLTPYFGVIADNDRVESIAGIMGGEHSSVTLDTTDVFLEAAFWHPTSIQGRCRQLNFSTDAAHRFERGVDFATNVEHMEYLTRLVLEICGTAETKVGPVVDQVLSLPERKPVSMRADRCRKVIGLDITDDQMARCFTDLGFDWREDNGVFTINPPTYRFDIEIEEDLIEEVARLTGFQNLPELPPMARCAMIEQPEGLRSRHALREKIAGLGFHELINYSFISEEDEKDFGNGADAIKVLNPIASQMAVMRSQLTAGLIETLKYNLNRKADRVFVFEYGRVFCKNPDIKGSDAAVQGVEQPVRIAALAYGPAHPTQWACDGRFVDFFDMKGALEQLAAPQKLRFEKAQHPAFHPGRSANVILDGQVIGILGELHPRLAQKHDLPHAPVLFEVDALPLQEVGVPMARAVSKHQALSRDIAVWVDDQVPVQVLLDAVRKASKLDERLTVVTQFELFDLYKPEQASEHSGQKSLAFAVKLQRLDGPVSESEADQAVAAILEVLGSCGAVQRK